MIYYALEALLLIGLVFVCFLVYRGLVNSPRFTRFIERTKGTESSLEDAAARIDVAEESARIAAQEAKSKVKNTARALRSYRRRTGS